MDNKYLDEDYRMPTEMDELNIMHDKNVNLSKRATMLELDKAGLEEDLRVARWENATLTKRVEELENITTYLRLALDDTLHEQRVAVLRSEMLELKRTLSTATDDYESLIESYKQVIEDKCTKIRKLRANR